MLTKLSVGTGVRAAAIAVALVSACSKDSTTPTNQDQPATSIGPSAGMPQVTAGQSPPAITPRAPNAGAAAAAGGVAGSRLAGRVAASMGGATAAGAAGNSAAGNSAAGNSAAGTNPSPVPAGQAGSTALPVCASTAPAEFEPNPNVGGGGTQFKDSPHFRIYGASAAQADSAIKALEAAYGCFVETLCWRSSGLSINDTSNSGPYSKMNIYGVGSLGNAAGQMFSDARAGLSYLRVLTNSIADPKVTVHEYGHALTYHEQGWIDQTRTGAWWETVANFVADTYLTSPLCAEARAAAGQPEGRTIIDLNKVISDSYQVIVDASSGSGNYYQAWPFLTYLTNNPDGYPGLGATALRDMFRKHMRNNETPLHVLERVAAPTPVQKIVGRYWARMAYMDIGHSQAQQAFMSGRSRLNFANLDTLGSGMFRVKANRQPRYFGSNIIPLKAAGLMTPAAAAPAPQAARLPASGLITPAAAAPAPQAARLPASGRVMIQVTSGARFTATLAIRSSAGAVRYVDLENGSGETALESAEEASLVVVNTPDTLYLYDPFQISSDAARGLDYSVQITGATPAN